MPLTLLLNSVAKIKSSLNPWKRNTTKLYITKRLFMLLESYAFGFTFSRIIIRTELQIMLSSIVLTSSEHLLERIKRWSPDEIIITITKNSSKDISNPTARSIYSKNGKEIAGIKTIENSRQNCSLSYTIPDWKNVRKEPIPIDISKLVI